MALNHSPTEPIAKVKVPHAATLLAISHSPSILKLPLEIVDLLARDYLLHNDWKQLRLTCRFFNPSMITLLFRRVILSKFRLDYDAFLSISQTPHLAAAARELVWYELSGSAINLDACDLSTEEAVDMVIPDLRLWVQPEAIWCASDSRYIRLRLGLEAMPNIHTFVSCCMPPWHVVWNNDYLVTAQLVGFEYLKGFNELNDFIFPMIALCRSAITRMIYHDQHTVSTLASMVQCVSPAFRNLTHIHIGIGIVLKIEQRSGNIRLALCAAEGLEELKIRRQTELGGGYPSVYSVYHKELDVAVEWTQPVTVLETLLCNKEGETPLWPRLRRLELEEFPVVQQANLRTIHKLLKAHASSPAT